MEICGLGAELVAGWAGRRLVGYFPTVYSRLRSRLQVYDTSHFTLLVTSNVTAAMVSLARLHLAVDLGGVQPRRCKRKLYCDWNASTAINPKPTPFAIAGRLELPHGADHCRETGIRFGCSSSSPWPLTVHSRTGMRHDLTASSPGNSSSATLSHQPRWLVADNCTIAMSLIKLAESALPAGPQPCRPDTSYQPASCRPNIGVVTTAPAHASSVDMHVVGLIWSGLGR